MNRDKIYVVGGGPSLVGFDFNKLKDLTTIVVNSAIIDVPDPNYFITSCPGYCKTVVKNNFYGKSPHSIIVISEVNKRWFETKPNIPKFDEWVIPSRGDGFLGFSWKHFAVGGSSGFAAMQYAFLSGYKKIYLLGIDVNTPGGKQHYHDRYTTMYNEIGYWQECFRQGLARIKEEGSTEVFSCSESSDLNDIIPFIKFEETF